VEEREDSMKINYQIMSDNQKNENGKYVPDIDKLIQTATCAEELEYIMKIVQRYDERKETGFTLEFAYNMIYITRLTCGHFEIFQTPCNEHYSLHENLKNAKTHAETSKCTKCICNW